MIKFLAYESSAMYKTGDAGMRTLNAACNRVLSSRSRLSRSSFSLAFRSLACLRAEVLLRSVVMEELSLSY